MEGGGLINAFDDGLLHRTKRPHVGHTIPSIGTTRPAAHGFIALKESRHEELIGQSGQLHAAPGIVFNRILGRLGINNA